MIPRATLLLALVGCTPRSAGLPPATEGDALAPTRPTPVARWAGPEVLAEVSVVAVGDLLMHTNVQRSAAAAAEAGVPHEGFPALFEPIRHRIQAADLAFANLETPVAPDHSKGTRSFVFNVSAALLPALEATGFDVLSFANNHVYDQGRAGFVETLDRLDASGMTYVGAGRTCDEAIAPRLVGIEGVKLAWIGATKLFNSDLNAGPDQPCAARLDVARALASEEAARAAGADVVIVSVHWGVEYRTVPEPAEVADARALVEGGVDVVIGHHPHVAQPIEVIETTDGRLGVVAYSLGNFVSNQTWWYRHGTHTVAKGRPRDGLMLAFDVVRKDYGPLGEGERVRTTVSNVRGIPLWTDNDATAAVAPAPTIRAVAVPDAHEAAHAALDAATTDAERLAAKERIELLRARWADVAGIVGDPFVEDLPP